MLWKGLLTDLTEQLYETNPYQKTFTATVLSCEPCSGNHWNVVLDRTAFYPEGGGQPYDLGTLDQVQVVEVHEQGEEIWHYTKEPLEEGCQVTAQIDWARRLDLMQQHSGEHIVSGIIHERYGYNGCITISSPYRPNRVHPE